MCLAQLVCSSDWGREFVTKSKVSMSVLYRLVYLLISDFLSEKAHMFNNISPRGVATHRVTFP